MTEILKQFKAGIALRGQWIESDPVEFGGRSAGITFLSPDPARIAARLPLVSPLMPGDLYGLSFDDILDYLEALGDLRSRWCH